MFLKSVRRESIVEASGNKGPTRNRQWRAALLCRLRQNSQEVFVCHVIESFGRCSCFKESYQAVAGGRLKQECCNNVVQGECFVRCTDLGAKFTI